MDGVGGSLVFMIITGTLVSALILTVLFFPHLKTAHKKDQEDPNTGVSQVSTRGERKAGVRYKGEPIEETTGLINADIEDSIAV